MSDFTSGICLARDAEIQRNRKTENRKIQNSVIKMSGAIIISKQPRFAQLS